MKNLTLTDKIALGSFLVAIIGAIPAWLALRPKPIPGPVETCNYAGRILDEVTEDPINGAEVSLDYKTNPYSERSDSKGFYRFANIPCDAKNTQADVTVEADGYKRHNQEVQLIEKIQDIRLTPTNRIDGTPIPPISPTITPTPSSNPGSSPQPTSSGESSKRGENLVKNPGFEEGLDSWQLYDRQVDIVTGHAGNAVCSKKITLSKEWAGIGQEVSVQPGQTYRFTARLKWENATQSHMKVEWRDTSNNPISGENENYAKDGSSQNWVPQSRDVTAPPNAVKAELIFWHGLKDLEIPRSGGTFCIDDVNFHNL